MSNTPIFDAVLEELGQPLGDKTPTHAEFMEAHGQSDFLDRAERILAGAFDPEAAFFGVKAPVRATRKAAPQKTARPRPIKDTPQA